MNGVPCNIHGLPALFLGITDIDHGIVAVYANLDKPTMFLHTTHPSNVQLVHVEAVTESASQVTVTEKIRLIKLLREAVDVAIDDDRRTVEDKLYLSLSTAKKLAEKFIEGSV